MEGSSTSSSREAWEQEQAALAAFLWFGESAGHAPDTGKPVPHDEPPEPVANSSAGTTRPNTPPTSFRYPDAYRVRLSGDIATDTGGELAPRYEYLRLRAEQLVSGDLMLEPHQGEVRITWLIDVGQYDPAQRGDLVQLRWTDDAGRSAAAHTVPAHQQVVVRVPDRRDGAVIQRAIDQSRYFGTSLAHQAARLIAAHLQRHPDNGLYRLAVTGEVLPSALAELDVIGSSRRSYLRRWSAALRGYCDQRPHHGPLFGLGREAE